MQYPFSLNFSGEPPRFASFPFMFDGVPAEGITCGISSRCAGGMSYAAEGDNPARLALFRSLGLDPARVYGLKQIHSREVLAVDSRRRPLVPADGMVSADPSIALSVTAADCLPVYLLDTESGAFGIVHSGWKGTGIALQALELMKQRWYTRPEAVSAVLGPCIGVCCYRVDEARAAAFERDYAAMPPVIAAEDGLFEPVTRRIESSDGAAVYLNLKAVNVRILAAAGVKNIAVCENCTCCDERLGSFRRESPAHGGVFTRMAALVFHHN